MKTSKIHFDIHLDNSNVPDKIEWDADGKPEGVSETRSISVSVWDHEQKNTLRIDLWTKDMPVDDMKRFYIESIGGMSQSVLRATGDEFMAREMDALCEKLVEYLRKNS